MQTATDMSTFELVEKNAVRCPSAFYMAARQAAKKADWEGAILKADRIISVAGGVAVALSALYFAPVLISILSR